MPAEHSPAQPDLVAEVFDVETVGREDVVVPCKAAHLEERCANRTADRTAPPQIARRSAAVRFRTARGLRCGLVAVCVFFNRRKPRNFTHLTAFFPFFFNGTTVPATPETVTFDSCGDTHCHLRDNDTHCHLRDNAISELRAWQPGHPRVHKNSIAESAVTHTNSTRIQASFRHSCLHILYVASPASTTEAFSLFMLHAFLKDFHASWGFNHLRLTNLCDLSIQTRAFTPGMDRVTASLLIINSLADLTGPAQMVLRQYCSQLECPGPFLVLVHVPRLDRSLMRRTRRKTLEQKQMDFFVTFFSVAVKEFIVLRALACPKYSSASVVKKVMRWIKRHNMPVQHVRNQLHVQSRLQAELPVQPKTSSRVTQVSLKKLLRCREYEDLASPRRTDRSRLRQTKSLSITQMIRADKKTPYYMPDEPRYDAEFDEFRSRRDARRFLRRLRDAMRDFRRAIAGPEQLAGADGGVLTIRSPTTARFGEDTTMTGLTELDALEDFEPEADEANGTDGDEDDENEDEHAHEEGDDMEIDWNDEATENPSTAVPIMSVTSSVAADVEPIILRMRLLQMADRNANTVQVDRRRAPLPVDSFETIFANSTFRQGNRAVAAPTVHASDRESHLTSTTNNPTFRQGVFLSDVNAPFQPQRRQRQRPATTDETEEEDHLV
ncbi:hypothetical protein BV898_17039, partial [Hypsibius exemplaris]